MILMMEYIQNLIILKQVEFLKIAFGNIKKIFTQIWDGAKKALFKIYSNNKEFRKLMTIYNRTKKKRTKKKYYNKMIRFITKSLKQ